MSEALSTGRKQWAVALLILVLALAALATLPLPCDDSHALVGGVALSGGRLELLRFLREPHQFPVVAATTSFPEMASALGAQAGEVAELPPPRENAKSWLVELHKQGVTHVVLYRDLPESSPRALRERAAADAIAALPDKFCLTWDGRWVEVYEVVR